MSVRCCGTRITSVAHMGLYRPVGLGGGGGGSVGSVESPRSSELAIARESVR